METPHTTDPEMGERDTICTRCGAAAEWIFVDRERTEIEVTCPNCGKFEMLRTEFDLAQSELVEPGEAE